MLSSDSDFGEPGFIMSTLHDDDVPVHIHPDQFKPNAVFRLKQSITFGGHLIYAGTLGLLREYTLRFDFGTYDGEPVTGRLSAQLDRMDTMVKAASVVDPNVVVRVPSPGDLVRLKHRFPLIESVEELPAGSGVFLTRVGAYHGPIDFIDVSFLQGGSAHRIMIQVFAIGTHMQAVSSIDGPRGYRRQRHGS